MLLIGSHKAGDHARRMDARRPHEGREWLTRAFNGASEYVATGERIATRQDFYVSLAALRGRVEVAPWKGTAGKTDLKNMLARLAICEQSGDWDHTVSERDLAERMGCSREAVRRSNSRLKDAGRIRQLDRGDHRNGARWMLILHVSRVSQAVSPTVSSGESHDETTPQGPLAGGAMSGLTVRLPRQEPNIDARTATRLMSEDAFAHLGLGGSGLAVVSALAERNGQSAAELVGTASISRPTAFRQLKKLAELGLVQKTAELYYLTEKATEGAGQITEECTEPVQDWEQAAQRLGTAGSGQRRRDRHDRERRHWETTQERLAERRRPATPAPNPRLVPQELVRPDGTVIDSRTGEITEWRVASDGELILPDPWGPEWGPA
ncbi:helix-turn-helix domain-containing protein [Streptomyces violaceusniger]|nr:helix-turn-helix domain-containing protein [Streptomyces violaceusniger]